MKMAGLAAAASATGLVKFILPNRRPALCGVAAAPFSLIQSINFEIKTLVQRGQHLEALQVYSKFPCFPWNATRFTFPSLLKACTALPNLWCGVAIHSTIITLGLQFDPYITTSLINMYVKCGSLSIALELFDIVLKSEVLVGDVTIWNSIVDGYFKYGYIEEGLAQFHLMQFLGTKPDLYSLTIVIGVCSNHLRDMEGKQVHGYVVKNMFSSDPFVVTALVDMYSSFGRPMDAWCVFQKLEDKKNVATWNAMIGGFCENGMWERSFELYRLLKFEIFPLDSVSFSCLLITCSRGRDAMFGRQLHCDIIKMSFDSDPYVCTSLITMYAKCKLVEDAEKVFHLSSYLEIEIWNAMISAYVNNSCAYDALKVFNQMRLSAFSPDSFTMSNVLAGCYMIGLFDYGLMLHGELMKRPMQNNVVVQSALLKLYSICGNMEDSISLFNTMKDKDVVAWGSIISGLCQNMKFREALEFFRAMEAGFVKPDSDLMATIISACKGLESVQLGQLIHGFVIKKGLGLDAFVASSLTDMYSAFGFPDMAENVFSGVAYDNLVIWNSMISFYCRNGFPHLSVNLFPQIIQRGLYPDFAIITSILVAVSSMSAILKGKAIHGYQMRNEISNLQVDNALIDMYIKCGSFEYAEQIFHIMSQRNLVTWNLMIAGYGSHGKCFQAITLFDKMRRTGITPDDGTFLSLISACNHSGLVSEGVKLFHSMGVEYQVEPKMEHYVSVVDLLGRAGYLDDAYSFIQNMPIEPDRNVWLCFLSACRAHCMVELGELAAHKLLKMEPTRGSNYVQLLTIYVEVGLWDRAANLRATMRQKGLKKNPGCSWIEVRDKVATFFSGDSSSSSAIEIYNTLDSLRSNMKKKGDGHE